MNPFAVDPLEICDITKMIAPNRLADLKDLSSPQDVAWVVGAALSLLASLIAIAHVATHLRSYTAPSHQRYIIRILLLVPISALLSWLSLFHYEYAVYISAVKDLYEAFAICSFLFLLLAFLGGGPQEQLRVLRSHKQSVSFFAPLCCISVNPRAPHILQLLKIAILQYYFARPLLSLLSIILQATGLYCPDSLAPSHARIWIVLASLASVAACMLALMILYLMIAQEIRHQRPLAKFLAFKAILFLSLWQGIVITAVVTRMPPAPDTLLTPIGLANLLASLVLAVEMLFFALLHLYIFPVTPYRAAHVQVQVSLGKAIVQVVSPTDILGEIAYCFRYVRWMAGGPLPMGRRGGEDTDLAALVAGGAFLHEYDEYDEDWEDKPAKALDLDAPPEAYTPRSMTFPPLPQLPSYRP